MSLPKVLIITESPRTSQKSRDIIAEIEKPLSGKYSVTLKSILLGDPKNGKAATKTELKSAPIISTKGFDLVILVGNTPLQFVTGKAGISKARGRPFVMAGITHLPMNNPSIIYHDPEQVQVLANDLKLVDDIIEFGGIPEERALSIRLVTNWAQFQEMLVDLKGAISFDIETNSLNPFQTHTTTTVLGKDIPKIDPAKIKSIGFGTRKNQWVLLVDHPQATFLMHDIKSMVDRISEVIEDCFMITHNGKFDMLWMRVHFGVTWHINFDTMIAHFLLNENMRHGLKYLAQVYLGAPDWEVDLQTKQGAGQSLDQFVKYHAHDLFYTRQLRSVFAKLLNAEPDVKQVFDHILMPCVNLFGEIEFDGVYIDVGKFHEAETYLREQYNSALGQLKQWEPLDLTDAKGRPISFNWGSPVQLGDLLYKRLKLPVIEKTPTGAPSCSESVIKRLNHPCTGALLKFREAKQQLSFFIDGWKPRLHERPDGFYLHPSFKLHGTVTGRLSCENPNLQQVPRDKRIRSLISAPEGWTLVECDLSQIELRIAAELAQESNMIMAFIQGIDIHWLTGIQEIARGGGLKDLVISTAKTWLNTGVSPTYSEAIKALLKMGPDTAIEINPGWKELRKKAKAINFGYLYGMWWKKFKDYARDNYGVIITDSEAEQSRIAFFDNYPDLNEWHNKQKRFVRKHGYVPTLSGRKRRLPDAQSNEDSMYRKAAERQAINSPVQSFANDINLMAALQLRSEFGRNVVRICGTVHDAILVRVRNDYVERVYLRLLEIMKRPALMDVLDIHLTVPVSADGSIGPWGSGVTLAKWKNRYSA